MNSSSNDSSRSPLPEMYICTIVVNIVISVPINGYMLWLIWTGSREGRASEFFSLNLAASDIVTSLVYCLIIVRIYVPSLVMVTIVKTSWFVIDEYYSLMLCCVCVERYMAVVHPVIYIKYKPLRYRLICLGLSCLCIAGLSAFQAVVNAQVIYTFYTVKCLFIVLVTFFCSIAILKALKKTGPGHRRQDMGSQKTRAFKIILIIMLSITIPYLAWFIDTLVFYGHWESEEYFISQFVILAINMLIKFVYPLLYLHKAKKFPCCRGL